MYADERSLLTEFEILSRNPAVGLYRPLIATCADNRFHFEFQLHLSTVM